MFFIHLFSSVSQSTMEFRVLSSECWQCQNCTIVERPQISSHPTPPSSPSYVHTDILHCFALCILWKVDGGDGLGKVPRLQWTTKYWVHMNVVTATFSTFATQSTTLEDHNWVLIPENMASLNYKALSWGLELWCTCCKYGEIHYIILTGCIQNLAT